MQPLRWCLSRIHKNDIIVNADDIFAEITSALVLTDSLARIADTVRCASRAKTTAKMELHAGK